MSIPKHDEFQINNTIDLGTDGRFGPGREKEFAKVANEKTFKHSLDRGAITYPLKTEEKKVDKKTATGSDAEPPQKGNEPEFEATGEWRTEEGVSPKTGDKTGWWRVIDPEGNFITNKREDEAKEFISLKNEELKDE